MSELLTSLALIRSCSISAAVGAARSPRSSAAFARVGRRRKEAVERKEKEARADWRETVGLGRRAVIVVALVRLGFVGGWVGGWVGGERRGLDGCIH